MSEVIDLNALVPQSVTIKIGDPAREIEILPPRTGDLLRMSSVGKQLQDVDKLSAEEIDNLEAELTAVVYKIIPALENQPLASTQLFKLVEIISSMATPPKTKELQDRGINAETPKANP